MSTATEQTAAGSPAPDRRWHAWGPSGLLFAVISLAAIGVGLFPELFLPARALEQVDFQPCLRMLLAAQAAFLILFEPLLSAAPAIPAGTAPQPSGPRGLSRTVLSLLRRPGRLAMYLVAGVPFYILAAHVSDASLRDVFRGLLYLVGVGLAGWGLSLWIASGRGLAMTIATGAALLATLGLPALAYALVEMTDLGSAARTLLHCSPLTEAFIVSASRTGGILPAPLWAWGLPPVAGAILALLRWAWRGRETRAEF